MFKFFPLRTSASSAVGSLQADQPTAEDAEVRRGILCLRGSPTTLPARKLPQERPFLLKPAKRDSSKKVVTRMLAEASISLESPFWMRA